mmetsp:Transcript_30508/g.59953  ORF Transcript_30508/g.59953 Transcript_30508/m.59953 type:complete len:162 (-) Transcript_30508:1904-2389(-)
MDGWTCGEDGARLFLFGRGRRSAFPFLPFPSFRPPFLISPATDLSVCTNVCMPHSGRFADGWTDCPIRERDPLRGQEWRDTRSLDRWGARSHSRWCVQRCAGDRHYEGGRVREGRSKEMEEDLVFGDDFGRPRVCLTDESWIDSFSQGRGGQLYSLLLMID